MKRFKLDKKLMVKVRYYETLFLINDKDGERVWTGTDEKTAKLILSILNGHETRIRNKKRKEKRKKKSR